MSSYEKVWFYGIVLCSNCWLVALLKSFEALYNDVLCLLSDCQVCNLLTFVILHAAMDRISPMLTTLFAQQEEKVLTTCINWFSLLESKIQLLLDKKVEEEVSDQEYHFLSHYLTKILEIYKSKCCKISVLLIIQFCCHVLRKLT